MGKIGRAVAREQAEFRIKQRFASTIMIGAAIIVAVRLSRASEVSGDRPEVVRALQDGVRLAGSIVANVAKTLGLRAE